MNEKTIGLLIIIHAVFGGVALLFGTGSLIATKGNKLHKLFGKIFSYSIGISALMAIFISFQKNHQSPFLFSIGILSLYFTISGNRALKYKSDITNIWLDYLVATLLLASSLYMIIYPIIIAGKLPILFAVFGILGISFAVRDFLNFRNKEKLQSNFLKLHLGNITGAYISSFTAFVVVNQWLPGIWGWIAPGVIGGLYITLWMNKLDKTKN